MNRNAQDMYLGYCRAVVTATMEAMNRQRRNTGLCWLWRGVVARRVGVACRPLWSKEPGGKWVRFQSSERRGCKADRIESSNESNLHVDISRIYLYLLAAMASHHLLSVLKKSVVDSSSIAQSPNPKVATLQQQ